MITDDQVLGDRAAVLAAAGHHTFTGTRSGGSTRRAATGATVRCSGCCHPSAGPARTRSAPSGRRSTSSSALADGVLRPDSRLHLPRVDHAVVAGRLAVAEYVDWDFHWTTAAPPAQPDEQRVVRLTDADRPALEALIEEAFPSTTSRPGDPRVVDWYGIRKGERA